MKVLKFGGTSVGSAENIKTLLRLVGEENLQQKPVVVLSAMSGVTNLLTDAAEKAERGEDYDKHLKEIEDKHFAVIRTLLPAAAQNPVFTRLKIFFNELEDLLQAVHNLKELSLQTKDQILSYGERCSTFMISHIASQQFAEALYVNGSEFIKTDSNFGQAKVDTALTEMLIKNFYAANRDKVLFVT
jgi:aspartokinase/homoserine dehydrogenase 1